MSKRVNIPEAELPAIGRRIAAARERLGLTGAQMADGLRVTRTYLSQVERGHKSPGPRLIEDLERVFGVNPDFVVRGEGDKLLLIEAKASSQVKLDLVGKQVPKSATVADFSPAVTVLVSQDGPAPWRDATPGKGGARSRGTPSKGGVGDTGSAALLRADSAMEVRPLVLSLLTEEAAGRKVDFEVIPKYLGPAAAGAAHQRAGNQDLDLAGELAVTFPWIRHNLGHTSGNLASIQVQGDSMAPTLLDGDTIIIDRDQQAVGPDGIYVFEMRGRRMVKRLQGLVDGSLVLISDNAIYQRQQLARDEAREIHVLGRMVWPRVR